MSEFINTADVIGDDEMCDQIIMKTVTEYKENRVKKIGPYAFYNCKNLTVVNAPNATSIEGYAFNGCTSLSEVNLPNISGISGSLQFAGCTNLIRADFPELVIPNHDTAVQMFDGCSSLEYVNLPKANALGANFFQNCKSLKSGVFPKVTQIGHPSWRVCFGGCTNLRLLDFHSTLQIVPCFTNCNSLVAIILRSNTMCGLYSAPSGKTDYGAPISSGTGYFYVPSALYDTYLAATNWSTIPSQIRKLEDYTIDGTITGALDESKI